MEDTTIDEIEMTIDYLKDDYAIAESVFEKWKIATEIWYFSALLKLYLWASK